MIIKQEEKLMLYLPARRQNGLQKWPAKYRTSRGRPGKSRQILLEGKSTERTDVSSMDYDVCFLKKAQSSVPSGIRASVRHPLFSRNSILGGPRQKRQHLRDLYTARRSFGDSGERYSLEIAWSPG
jgi:hypothetical protein